MPERYEASLASLENIKDLCKITLAEVILALQQRLMRPDCIVEGVLPAKSHQSNFKKNDPTSSKNIANS